MNKDNLVKRGESEKMIKNKRITNKGYREMFEIINRTALRDLNTLCEKIYLSKSWRNQKRDKVSLNPTFNLKKLNKTKIIKRGNKK